MSDARSSLIPLALVALSTCGEAQEATPYREVAVDVQLEAAVAESSERFVSFSVDSAQAFGGKFWSASGEASLVGDEQRPPYDFTRERLRALAAPLAPGWLRIGGSAADVTTTISAPRP